MPRRAVLAVIVEPGGDPEEGKYPFIKGDRTINVADREEYVIEHERLLLDDVVANNFDILGVDPAAILSQKRGNRTGDFLRLMDAPEGGAGADATAASCDDDDAHGGALKVKVRSSSRRSTCES